MYSYISVWTIETDPWKGRYFNSYSCSLYFKISQETIITGLYIYEHTNKIITVSFGSIQTWFFFYQHWQIFNLKYKRKRKIYVYIFSVSFIIIIFYMYTYYIDSQTRRCGSCKERNLIINIFTIIIFINIKILF